MILWIYTMAMNHKVIDEVNDVLREAYEAVEYNLKLIPLAGAIRNTPLAQVNREIMHGVREGKGMIRELAEGLNIDIKETSDGAIESLAHSVRRMTSADALRRDMVRAIAEGIEHQPRIKTPSGRSWGYKEYMEMATRTTLAHELGERQLDTGGKAGIVFYVTNVFQDCADDHKDFQGKYYYDMRFKEFGYDAETVREIERLIREKKVLPLQHSRDNPPYMTTRPNCRHTFTPVSIEQVGGVAPMRLVRELGILTGSYKDDKYKATQQLRYFERGIRDYDNRARMALSLALTAKREGKMEVHDGLMRGYKEYMRRKRQWQSRRRGLLSVHEHLAQDTRRETRRMIMTDMGAMREKLESKMERVDFVDERIKELPKALHKYLNITMNEELLDQLKIDCEKLGFDYNEALKLLGIK